MSEYARQIVDWIMSGVAAVGGMGAVIAIVTTVIKTFGGNSIKSKLAANKVDMDSTLAHGLDGIKERINTDITIDVSAQVNNAVERETRALRECVATLREDINVMREGLATVIDYEAERKARFKQDTSELLAKSAQMRDVQQIAHDVPAVAHITLTTATAPNSEAIDEQAALAENRKVVI